MGSFRLQRLVHWLELGQGKRIIRFIGLLVFIGLFTWYHGYKRFAGPSSENVIEFALIGKNLSEGKGFTSPVIYPQTLAFLENQEASYQEAKQGNPRHLALVDFAQTLFGLNEFSYLR